MTDQRSTKRTNYTPSRYGSYNSFAERSAGGLSAGGAGGRQLSANGG
jgi:hypothetical protein